MDTTTKNIMLDLEKKHNPVSSKKGSELLQTALANNDPNPLLEPIKNLFEEFKKKTGRDPSYSEIREMCG